MDDMYAKMTKGGLVDSIKFCEQVAINLQKYATDLEAGLGFPKDPISRAELIESNAKNIKEKIKRNRSPKR